MKVLRNDLTHVTDRYTVHPMSAPRNHTLTVKVTKDLYEAIREEAVVRSVTPSQVVYDILKHDKTLGHNRTCNWCSVRYIRPDDSEDDEFCDARCRKQSTIWDARAKF